MRLSGARKCRLNSGRPKTECLLAKPRSRGHEMLIVYVGAIDGESDRFEQYHSACEVQSHHWLLRNQILPGTLVPKWIAQSLRFWRGNNVAAAVTGYLSFDVCVTEWLSRFKPQPGPDGSPQPRSGSKNWRWLRSSRSPMAGGAEAKKRAQHEEGC